LSILSATKDNLNELSVKQKASFENSTQQFSQIATTTTTFAQNIHTQLDESKKVQELALQRVSGGFAAISSSQDEIHSRQQQLLLSVAGTHGKLEELQQRNKDSFEAASTHLTSIREQSQQAEERVQKVMAGLEGRLEAGFQRLLSLDHSILGELFTIKAVVFYASCCLVLFLCTASKQTQRVRPHLFLAVVLNYYLETQALYYTEWFLFTDHLLFIALLRKVFVCCVCLGLGCAAWRFRDFHELSYETAKQNQNILFVILQHLKKRAATDHVDTNDLDSALALLSGDFKHQLLKDFKLDTKPIKPLPSSYAASSSSSLDLVPPPLERMDEEPEAQHQQQEESKHTLVLPPIREEEVAAAAAREEDSTPSEAVSEEPCEREPEGSPRCTAIAKKSGQQCKNSARKCRSHPRV